MHMNECNELQRVNGFSQVIYAANFKDILANIKKAMNEEPPTGTTVTNSRTTERAYKAQILDLNEQLVEARERIDELTKKAGEAALIAAAAPTPVLAAGGIGNGGQMAAALAMGAQGVWTGSLWLTVEEAAA